MNSKAIPNRSQIEESDKWNIKKVYESIEQWQKDYSEIEKMIEKYDSLKGTAGNSVNKCLELIEFDLEVSRKIDKVYLYAHLLNDQDKTNDSGETLYQRAVTLFTKISEKSSFIVPEIQSLDDEILEKYLESQELTQYRFYLEKIIRFKPHTLPKESEEILAMSGEVFSTAGKIFSQLDNADLRFGDIVNGKGENIELSHGNFISLLHDCDAAVRKNAFHQYYDAYDNHKYTLASSLSFSVKKDWLKARLRKYSSCREAALFTDNVPIAVYDNLIESVKKSGDVIKRYMSLRKKALNVKELHFYDTYVPIINDVDFCMGYKEAVETCVAAVSPLGADYASIMKEGLLGGWVDRYENRGKRSGAYSSGCYDSDPYILMNYDKTNINSLYTLMHEAGHSMHSYFSRQKQPYVYSDYTIFVAEVASTFNETLLSDYLLKKYADNKKMKAYILNREIDNIRGTLFRQTMFAEFEHLSHAEVEKGNPLTIDKFREIYRGLLEEYFGDSIVIDDTLELECLRIPHFYSAFYVYKYATGISAAVSLASGVLQGKQGACDNYRQFLTLGGSMYPIEELKVAGVDMSRPDAVNSTLSRFKELVLEMESLI
ncbi:MAG TPA: oligoendopeptidase F [Spirochaetota bacterium]|nr:oligoendopeptidase F [Spirochaetota bacterium]